MTVGVPGGTDDATAGVPDLGRSLSENTLPLAPLSALRRSCSFCARSTRDGVCARATPARRQSRATSPTAAILARILKLICLKVPGTFARKVPGTFQCNKDGSRTNPPRYFRESLQKVAGTFPGKVPATF